jgi:hypothetical protein
MRYDPRLGPDPAEWLALGEAERITAIEDHHRRSKVRSGNARAHAGIDSAVETQLAEGMPVVVRTLERLLKEGLARPDAVHAIGTAIAAEMFEILKEKRPFDAQSYGRRLQALSASTWSGKGRA